LDTAAAYGEAEARLGSWLAGDKTFKICTKLAPPATGEFLVDAAQRSFARSLRRLRRDRVDALLVHAASSLLSEEGDALWRWLTDLSMSGEVGGIGVSLYDAVEIDALLQRYTPDWVQVPTSVFDQRLLRSGHLARLWGAGISVQIRSVLLQGLVTAEPDALPEAFAGAILPLNKLDVAAQATGDTKIDLALSFAATLADVELAVLGVTTADELRQCINIFRRPVVTEWAQFACVDPAVVDPRRWPIGLKL
ncbi:MAG TPA: aldo/keto reductase, partial [Rhodocyclaceae bacterium]|nr:aldo/keto reductase [Rhodocyclaceae bacterium]